MNSPPDLSARLEPLPERFNIAAHLLAVNAERGDKLRLHRRHRAPDLPRAGRARAALRRGASAPRAAPRGPRADGDARQHRLPDRLSRCALRRHRAGRGEHAADDRRLRLHARALPGPCRAGLARPVADASARRSRAPSASRRPCRSSRPGRAPTSTGPCRSTRCSTPSRSPNRPTPWPTTSASGSIHRARPAVRRAPSTPTRTCTGPRRCTATPILGLREDDVCFSAAKLFFAYGLGNALTFPLSVGATTVLMAERPTPAAVFKRWTEQQVTVFFGAPTGYAGMLAAPDLPEKAQVALRLCSSAGEALPREIGERFKARFGCDIVDGIGSTEMLHIFLSNRPGDVDYGSTGRAVPGYALRLVNEAACRTPRRARSAISTSAARARPSCTGPSATSRARRSRASGRRPATSTRSTSAAATSMPAAATTC